MFSAFTDSEAGISSENDSTTLRLSLEHSDYRPRRRCLMAAVSDQRLARLLLPVGIYLNNKYTSLVSRKRRDFYLQKFNRYAYKLIRTRRRRRERKYTRVVFKTRHVLSNIYLLIQGLERGGNSAKLIASQFLHETVSV